MMDPLRVRSDGDQLCHYCHSTTLAMRNSAVDSPCVVRIARIARIPLGDINILKQIKAPEQNLWGAGPLGWHDLRYLRFEMFENPMRIFPDRFDQVFPSSRFSG